MDKILPSAEVIVRMPAKAGATEFQLLGPVSGARAAPAEASGDGIDRARPVLVRVPLPGALTLIAPLK